MAAQPAYADQGYYYRQRPTSGTASSPATGGPPSAGTNDSGAIQAASPRLVVARTRRDNRTALYAANARQPLSWSSTGSAPPPGLSIDPSGAVVGRPSGPASADGVVATVVDANGASASTSPFTVVALDPPQVSVGSASVAVGKPAEIAPATSNVLGPATWAVTGTLPPGLSLDPASGRLSGTPGRSGLFAGIVLSVTDVDGTTASSQAFTVEATSPLSVTGIEDAYRVRLGAPIRPIRPSVTGNAGPALWDLAPSSAPLPPGLAIDANSGAVTGLPARDGKFPGLSLRATDATSGASNASAPFSVSVAPMPGIAVASPYRGRTGARFAMAPVASGTIGATAWTLTGGLPDGTGLDDRSGTLSGTLATVGSWRGLSLALTDMFDGARAASDPFDVVSYPPLSLQVASAPPATVGTPYSISSPAVSGLVGSPSFSLSGDVPPGLSVDTATGAVGGAVASPGYREFSVVVTDAADGATASAPMAVSASGQARPATLAVSPVLSAYRAKAGSPFAMAAGTTGAAGPVTWRVTGDVPAWLTLDPASGVLSGTPTVPEATPPLALVADDGMSVASSATFHVEVDPAGNISLDVPALMAGMVGQPFSGPQPTVTGARGGLSFSLAAGTLPEGLSLSPSTGILSGTPAVAGDQPGLVLAARDATGAVAVSAPFTVSAYPAPGADGTVLQASMPSVTGEPGRPLSASPSATGLGQPASWSVAQGALPGWASLDPATGTVSGTPDAAGTATGIVLLARGSDGARVRTNAFAVSVVTSPTLSAGMQDVLVAVNRPVNARPSLFGARGAVDWSLGDGTLPPGLSVDPATGALEGVPAASGTWSGLTLRVRDETGTRVSTNAFSVEVAATAMQASWNGGRIRTHAGRRLATAAPTVSGNSGPVTWSLVGETPPSVTADADGRLAGSPATPASYDGLVLVARDAAGETAATPAFGMDVLPPLGASLSDGMARAGMPFATAASASDAVGAVTWQASQGPLPAWMTLDPATGRLYGTPDATGTFAVPPLVATDSTGSTATTAPASVTVLDTLAASVPDTSYRARVGVPLRLPPATANASVTWSVQGMAPAWLATDPATGGQAGTPDAPGTWTYALQARDASGYASRTATVTVVASAAPSVALGADQGGRTNSPIAVAPVVTGAVGTQAWSLASGTLPGWASLDPSTGRITGSAPATGTTDGLRLRIVDSEGATGTSQAFSIRVRDGISVAGLPGQATLRVGLPSTQLQAVAVGAAGAISWSSSGLPDGLSLSAAGLLSGTPTKASSGTLTVSAVDASDGASARADVPYTVIPAMQATGAAGLRTHVGPFSLGAPALVGQRGTVSWRLATGAIPADSSLAPGTGILSGTATAPGTFSGISLEARDGFDGATARTAPVDITVIPQPTVTNVSASYMARVGLPASGPVPYLADSIGAVSWAWSTDAAPPPWATMDPSTGAVGGTPDAQGTFGPLRLVGTDATGASAVSVPFSVSAYALPGISVAATSLRVRVGGQINVSPTASGIAGTPSWTLSTLTGATPPGVSFSPATGSLAGTATAAGGGTFRIAVTDPADGRQATTPELSVSVLPALSLAAASPAVSTHSGAFLSTGRPTVSGLVGAPSYAATNLPDGLTVDDTGTVSGTPSVPQGWSGRVTLTLTDAADGTTASTSFALTVLPPLQATFVPSPRGRAGTDLRASVAAPSAVNATPGAKLAWALVSGSLPDGVSVDPDTGRLQGVPGTPGTYPAISLRVSDPDGASSVTPPADLAVGPALVASAAAMPTGATELSAYDARPGVTGILGTATWSAAALPPWLSLDPATGRIYGTPPTGASSGPQPAPTLSVTDSWDRATSSASLAMSVAGVAVMGAPATATLPDQNLPDPGACLAIPVTNRGTVAATGMAFAVTSGSASASICVPASGACGTTLAAGDSCSAGARLSAQSSGSKAATLTVTADTGPAATVSLTGMAYDRLQADPFSIPPATNQVPGARVTSQAVTPKGMTASVAGSVSGPGNPLMSVAGGPWLASAPVSPGQSVQVQATAASSGNTSIAATLTVGGTSSDFVVTTGNPTANPFSFIPVTNATPSTPVTSSATSLTGMTVEAPLAVASGGNYAVRIGVNGSTPSATPPDTVPANATLVLSMDAAPSPDGSTRSATVTVGGVAATWTVSTLDSQPDPFSFSDLTDVPGGQTSPSAPVTPTGYSSPAAASVTGEGSPQMSVAGGAWTTTGTLSPGQAIQLRLTAASAENGTPRTATLTVGGVTVGWTVTTRDTIPDTMAFASTGNQPLSTLVQSAPVTVTGISTPSPVSVSGSGSPQVRIGGASGTWVTSGYVTSGQTVEARLTTAAADSTSRTATVTVGGVAALWQVTTGRATPDPFQFANVTAAPPGTPVASVPVTLSGTTIPGSLTLTAGGSYPVRIGINGADPTANAPATVPAGASLVLSLDAPATSDGATRSATVSVNGVSTTWSVSSADTVPDAFAFTSRQGLPVNSVAESAPVTITGITAPAPVTVTGAGSPEVSVAGGSWGSGTAYVSNGQTVAVRLTTASANLTTRSATVTVGGGQAQYSATTAGVDSTPDAFSVPASPGLNPNVTALTGDILLAGYDAPASLSVTTASGTATPQVSVAGGPWVTSANIYPGQSFKVRTPVGAFGTSATVTVTAGGVSANWTVSVRQPDTDPDPFTIPSLAGQPGRSSVTSARVQPVGYLDPAPVSVSGPGSPQVSMDGTTWGTTATISPGQSLSVRLTSDIPDGVTSTATVQVGTVTAPFTVTTLDSMPDIPWTKDDLVLASLPVSCCACNPAKPLQGFTSPVVFGNATCAPTVGPSPQALYYSNSAFRGTNSSVTNPGDPVSICVVNQNNSPGDYGTCTYDLGGRSVTMQYGYAPAQPTPNQLPQLPFYAGQAPGSTVVTPATYVTGNTQPSLISVSAPAQIEIGGNGTWYQGGTGVRLPVNGTFRVRVQVPSSGTQRVYVYHGESGQYSQYFEVTSDAPRASFASTPNASTDPIGGNVIGGHLGTNVTIAVGNSGNVCAPYTSGPSFPVGVLNNGSYPQFARPWLTDMSYGYSSGWEWKTSGVVCPGEILQFSVYPPSVAGQTVRGTLAYGNATVPESYTLAGAGIDGQPDPFSFPSLSGQAGNSQVTSSAVTLTGFTTQASVTVSGQGSPQVSVGGRAWTTSDAISPGESVAVRLSTAAGDGSTYVATVVAGGVSATWTVGTADTTPDAFAFAAQSGLDPGTFLASAPMTVSGLGGVAAVTLSGPGSPQVSINSGGLATSGTVRNGDTVQVFANAPSGYSASQSVTVAIGYASATWTLATRAADTTPAAFSVPARTDQPVSSLTQSDAVRPTAYLDPTGISVTGDGNPAVSVDGGPWLASATISPGQSFAVRLTSPATKGATGVATVTVGGIAAQYLVTTAR